MDVNNEKKAKYNLYTSFETGGVSDIKDVDETDLSDPYSIFNNGFDSLNTFKYSDVEINSDIDEDTQEQIFSELDSQIKSLQADYKAAADSQGFGGWVLSLFGGGSSALKSDLDSKTTLLNEAKEDPSKLQDVYKTIMNSELTPDRIAQIQEANRFTSSLSDEGKEAIVNTLKQEASFLSQDLQKEVDGQGWFGKTINWINNGLDIGTSENNSKAQIQQYQELVNGLDPDSPDFAAQFKTITGEDLSTESLEKMVNGVSMVSNSSAAESILDYNQTQNSANDIASAVATAAIVTIAVAAAPFTGGASIALAAGVGAVAMTGIKASDGLTSSRGYSLEQGIRDFATGAIQGVLIPVSGAFGKTVASSLIKTNLGKIAQSTVTGMATGGLYGAGYSAGSYSAQTIGTENFSVENLLKTTATGTITGMAAGTAAGFSDAAVRPFLTSGSTVSSQVSGRILTGGISGTAAGSLGGAVGSGTNYILNTEDFSFDEWLEASADGLAKGSFTGLAAGMTFEAIHITAGAPKPEGTAKVKTQEIDGIKVRRYLNSDGETIAMDVRSGEAKALISKVSGANSSQETQSNALIENSAGGNGTSTERTIRFSNFNKNVERTNVVYSDETTSILNSQPAKVNVRSIDGMGWNGNWTNYYQNVSQVPTSGETFENPTPLPSSSDESGIISAENTSLEAFGSISQNVSPNQENFAPSGVFSGVTLPSNQISGITEPEADSQIASTDVAASEPTQTQGEEHLSGEIAQVLNDDSELSQKEPSQSADASVSAAASNSRIKIGLQFFAQKKDKISTLDKIANVISPKRRAAYEDSLSGVDSSQVPSTAKERMDLLRGDYYLQIPISSPQLKTISKNRGLTARVLEISKYYGVYSSDGKDILEIAKNPKLTGNFIKLLGKENQGFGFRFLDGFDSGKIKELAADETFVENVVKLKDLGFGTSTSLNIASDSQKLERILSLAQHKKTDGTNLLYLDDLTKLSASDEVYARTQDIIGINEQNDTAQLTPAVIKYLALSDVDLSNQNVRESITMLPAIEVDTMGYKYSSSYSAEEITSLLPDTERIAKIVSLSQYKNENNHRMFGKDEIERIVASGYSLEDLKSRYERALTEEGKHVSAIRLTNKISSELSLDEIAQNEQKLQDLGYQDYNCSIAPNAEYTRRFVELSNFPTDSKGKNMVASWMIGEIAINGTSYQITKNLSELRDKEGNYLISTNGLYSILHNGDASVIADRTRSFAKYKGTLRDSELSGVGVLGLLYSSTDVEQIMENLEALNKMVSNGGGYIEDSKLEAAKNTKGLAQKMYGLYQYLDENKASVNDEYNFSLIYSMAMKEISLEQIEENISAFSNVKTEDGKNVFSTSTVVQNIDKEPLTPEQQEGAAKLYPIMKQIYKKDYYDLPQNIYEIVTNSKNIDNAIFNAKEMLFDESDFRLYYSPKRGLSEFTQIAKSELDIFTIKDNEIKLERSLPLISDRTRYAVNQKATDTIVRLAELRKIDGARLLEESEITGYAQNDEVTGFVSSAKFNNSTKQLLTSIGEKFSGTSRSTLMLYVLTPESKGFSKYSLTDKITHIETLRQVLEDENYKSLTPEQKTKLNLEEKINRLQNSLKHTITPTEVSDEDIKAFSKGFLANNNAELEETLKTTDFSAFGKEGVPLEYSRTSFLSKLDSILSTLSDEKRSAVIEKLGIETTETDGKITGYNGIIDLSKLNLNDPSEKEIYEECHKFIKENKVVTDDERLNSALNSLIQGMPEFVNVIGKQQHATHNLSVDAHILKVLQEAMSNPQYESLSDLDKTVLKTATVLHDIAKSEGEVDEAHPQVSALYARNILEKYPFPEKIRDRIFELVKNHHWLGNYNTGKITKEYTASLFRHKDDYTIAKIMAEADLKGVSSDFYEQNKNGLSEEKQASVAESLDSINSNGQLIFTNKVIKDELIPTVEYNGNTYKVIDVQNLAKGEDLSSIGFTPGSTKENFRLFVHMAGTPRALKTVDVLSDIANSGFLCVSLVSPDRTSTYYGLKFGVSLEGENVNIANANNENQSSGGGKSFEQFTSMINQNETENGYRKKLPGLIKSKLGLTDSQYKEFYEKFAAKKYLSQIRDDRTYTIDSKTFSGKEIKAAIQESQDWLLTGGGHSEANLYNPKINGFVAKVDSIDEIPDEFLKFARDMDLPIYLLGGK